MINFGANRVGLARAIQEAVRNYTTDHAMPPDEIISTMAFCTGCAIGVQPEGPDKRRYAEIAVKFLDDGDQVASEKKTNGLIDIRGLVPN